MSKINYIKELLWSKGHISSKRLALFMMFTNAIVLSYVGGAVEVIKTFIYAGLLLAGVTASEKVLNKTKKEGKEEDSEK